MATENPTVQVNASKVPSTSNSNPTNEDAELNMPFIDKRNITISLVHNYSDYRKANMKTLGQRKETIGSSISSCRVLSSNKGEVEAYFPEILGLSPNNPEFVSRVKGWLSNIQFVIAENDVKLDTSFRYDKKSDYLKIKAKEDAIEEAYAKVNRSNISELKTALKNKIEDLNLLESEKYLYGRPINLEQYLMYRHCLLYKDVAKDTALINSDPNIRFYIKDDAKEAEKQKKITEEKMKAMRNFIELTASPSKFNAVYIAMCSERKDNIALALAKTDTEKNNAIMDYINNNPDKFNKLYNDKNIITKAFIETLIIRGELVRAEYNQQISTADGQFIGSNMIEAVAFLNNPNNAALKTVLENKCKLF